MVTLGAATIAAQQALSDKFGIPTFTLTGGISTVPTGGRLSLINVGTGGFGGETFRSFTTNLQTIINQVRQTGGTIGNTVFITPVTSGGSTSPQGAGGNTQAPAGGGGAGGFQDFNFGEAIGEGLKGTGQFLTNNPSALILLIGVGALLVLKS